MPRMIELIRASKLPSNMMQFAAKGALSVSPEENIEILVYLARHNKIFGDTARLTLAGWDEKSSLAVASDPKTPSEVLDYLIAPENLRPQLLPALLENSSVSEGELSRSALAASPGAIAVMLKSPRVRASAGVLDILRSNPYLKPEQSATISGLLNANQPESLVPVAESESHAEEAVVASSAGPSPDASVAVSGEGEEIHEVAIAAYLSEHATEIAAEKDKPFQPVGGIVELLGTDYFPVSESKDITAPAVKATSGTDEKAGAGVAPARSKPAAAAVPLPAHRENTVQKINHLDVKGRIQLAMKGNKEERSILIRDGTKVVALAVLDAPKISDGEVEKFALQKNVLEAVLRQIPLKRRFMKNYIVVRNLVSNPRTPLDLGLGLMKHLQTQDLKNVSANKEVSETVRKLAMKMYKQKLDAANKK